MRWLTTVYLHDRGDLWVCYGLGPLTPRNWKRTGRSVDRSRSLREPLESFRLNAGTGFFREARVPQSRASGTADEGVEGLRGVPQVRQLRRNCYGSASPIARGLL